MNIDESIRMLDLSVRALNALRHANIYTVEDLVRNSRQDLLKNRNLGKKCLERIEEALYEEGFHLRREEPRARLSPRFYLMPRPFKQPLRRPPRHRHEQPVVTA